MLNHNIQVDTMSRLLSAVTPIRIKGEEESVSRDLKSFSSCAKPKEELVERNSSGNESSCAKAKKDFLERTSSGNESSSMLSGKPEEPSSFMSEDSKSLRSEMETDVEGEKNEEKEGEDEEFKRKREDSLETQKYWNSSQETVVSRDVGVKKETEERNDEGEGEEAMQVGEEAMEVDEEVEKGEVVVKVNRSEEEATEKSSDVASQDIFEDIENVGKMKDLSDESQTLTADSKAPVAEDVSQSLIQDVPKVPQDLESEALLLKQKLLDSSSSEKSEGSSLSDSSSSDSDLSSGEVLKKFSNSAKKSSARRNSVQRPKSKLSSEEREIQRLTNLKSLAGRRRLSFDDNNDDDICDDDDSGTWHKKQECKKVEKKKKEENGVKLLDFLDGSDDSDVKVSDVEKVEFADPEKQFWKSNNEILKEVVLASSGSSDTESTITSDSMFSKKKKKKSKKILDESGSDESSSKSRPSWMNDRLLREKLSESESEVDDEEKVKEKKRKSPDVILESSEEEKFKKKKKKRRVKISDIETSDSDIEEVEVEHVSPVKSQETPTKGRKNIRKILMKDNLQLSTRQALDMEKNRKKRIEERKKVYNELFANREDSLILDYDPITKKPLLSVHKKLVEKLKPHQREGVKFMWESCFESLKRSEEESGSGCILAHCMGLGKTLQAITLVHTLLTNNTGVHSIIIVCPMNTVANWRNEFRTWLKNLDGKRIDVYDLSNCKKYFERSIKLKEWHEKGGVMIISYDMFRILTRDLKTSPLKNQVKTFEMYLLDPGPDLIICDEGHKIKNDSTALSKCIRRIKTSRRVVLTGTPLQNNLNEYYFMVNFIKPNILGSNKEFRNRFLNPINNGQFKDSTLYDVSLMKKRSHVLHTMLDGCIQRYDYSVLTPFLPEKHEYVISVYLTETQAKLYEYYLKNISSRSDALYAKIFSDYQCLMRVWTHPATLRAHMEHKSKGKVTDDGLPKEMEIPPVANENWWKDIVPEEEFEDINASGKLVLLFSILVKAGEIGDKVLVFSSSLYALNLIEHFLNKKSWKENYDYFKLTGGTSGENRARCCKLFNDMNNKRARLFLISTKAGGLGINLIGANRVILFDASWNPSNDVQSIFRVYRFGQKKPCYIYRFLAGATMEETIYERQVTKLSLADRVVDEHQIERHYTMGNLQELYNYNPIPRDKRKIPDVPKDTLFAEIVQKHLDIIVRIHEHDSLLENKQDEELTEDERKAAWEEFEKEKYTENRIPPQLANSLQNQVNGNKNPGVNQISGVDSDDIKKMVEEYLRNPFAEVNDNGVSGIRIDKVESLSENVGK